MGFPGCVVAALEPCRACVGIVIGLREEHDADVKVGLSIGILQVSHLVFGTQQLFSVNNPTLDERHVVRALRCVANGKAKICRFKPGNG